MNSNPFEEYTFNGQTCSSLLSCCNLLASTAKDGASLTCTNDGDQVSYRCTGGLPSTPTPGPPAPATERLGEPDTPARTMSERNDITDVEPNVDAALSSAKERKLPHEVVKIVGLTL